MSQSLGGYLDLPHGLCNAVLVEHVVAFNYDAAPDRFKIVAQTLGIDTRGLNHRQVRERLVQHLINLKQSIGFKEASACMASTCRTSPSFPSMRCRTPAS